MAERVTLRACPYCGSMDTHPALLFGGPLPWVDHNDGGYQCRSCGKTAVPLDFDSLEDLSAFQKSIRAVAGGKTDDFIHIPIMPVDTASLFNVPVLKYSVGQVANVVEVDWDGGYRVRGKSARFSRYWSAVQSPRYSAKEVMLLDLAGVRDGHPNFDVLKKLIRTKYQVWLDLGVRDLDDVFDAFTMDVARTVIGSLTAPDLDVFKEAFDISDRVVPCLHWSREVLWSHRDVGPRDLGRAIAAMKDIGFDTIGVIDMTRLGRGQGVDRALVERLSGMGDGMIVGGGVIEKDLDLIRASGLKGAFMDPFTPVIGDLILEEERELPTDDVAPAVRPLARGSVVPGE